MVIWAWLTRTVENPSGNNMDAKMQLYYKHVKMALETSYWLEAKSKDGRLDIVEWQ